MSSINRSALAMCLFSLLLVIPFLLWVSYSPPSITNPSLFMKTLGQVSAVGGVIFFAIEFVLAARFGWIENLLSGLNQVYLRHHLLGGIALILLLLHPLFLGVHSLSLSVLAAYHFFLPEFSQTGQWLGIVALLALGGLLVLTFFIRLAYETWYKTHVFLGLPFILAFFHTLLVPGMLSQNPVLKAYLIGVYLIGIFAYGYRLVKKTSQFHYYRYQVKGMNRLTANVWEFALSPHSKPVVYDSGQFVFLDFHSSGIPREFHPFSLTSDAASPQLRVGIKTSGDYTRSLRRVKVGDWVMVDGPYGHFTQRHILAPYQVWIAGGIGITPFIGFIRTLSSSPSRSHKSVWLWYSVSDRKDAPYVKELEQYESQLPWFKLFVHETSSGTGRLTLAKIATQLPRLKHYDILLCGPSAMIDALKRQAKKIGLSASRIHSEEFKLLD